MKKDESLIIEKLKKIPHCIGIIYAGSRIEGDFTDTSDYDFTVLLDKGESYYKTFCYKDLLIDICCATTKVIYKQDFDRDKVANAELSILAHGKIVFDKSGQIGAVQKKAKKVWALGPKKDTKEAGYLCAMFLHTLNKQNSELAYYEWTVITNKLVKLFFALHNTWLPKSFQVENKIKELDEDFFKFFDTAYQSDIKNKVNSTKQMIQYLIKKFNLPHTKEICFPKDEK
ncbi:MAG: nucleotidyltransferase domain-containing protein [bacterium]